MQQLKDSLKKNACITDYGLESQFEETSSARYATLLFLADTDRTYTQFPITDDRLVLERYTVALFEEFLTDTEGYQNENAATCESENIGCNGDYIDSINFGMCLESTLTVSDSSIAHNNFTFQLMQMVLSHWSLVV